MIQLRLQKPMTIFLLAFCTFSQLEAKTNSRSKRSVTRASRVVKETSKFASTADKPEAPRYYSESPFILDKSNEANPTGALAIRLGAVIQKDLALNLQIYSCFGQMSNLDVLDAADPALLEKGELSPGFHKLKNFSYTQGARFYPAGVQPTPSLLPKRESAVLYVDKNKVSYVYMRDGTYFKIDPRSLTKSNVAKISHSRRPAYPNYSEDIANLAGDLAAHHAEEKSKIEAKTSNVYLQLDESLSGLACKDFTNNKDYEVATTGSHHFTLKSLFDEMNINNPTAIPMLADVSADKIADGKSKTDKH